MLTCDQFTYAAAPRTGVEWFIQATTLAGFTLQGDNAHVPPPQDHNGLVVTVVRHPYDWLVSLFLSSRKYTNNESIDDLYDLMEHYERPDEFIRSFLSYCPGEVGLMFDSYNASTVMRLEDQPWAACDFFDPLCVDPWEGAERLLMIDALPPCNCRVGQPVLHNFNLRALVVKAEREFCQRYDYS